jgi:hypothetical protein
LSDAATTGRPVTPLALAPTEPAEPKTRRARKPGAAKDEPGHWPKGGPSPEAEAAIRRILAKLSDAREAAGWHGGRLRVTSPLDKGRHGLLALRLYELRRDGEDDPEALMVAVLLAKVAEHRKRDGEHGAGVYANAVSPLRPKWWETSLTAGRAWLASGGRPAASRRERVHVGVEGDELCR